MKSQLGNAHTKVLVLMALAFTGCGVTRVDTGIGVTGGPITATGTVALDTAYTDGRYARLNADNLFNGNQTIHGMATISVPFGTLGGENSFSVTNTPHGDALTMASGTTVGQVLHIRCTQPVTDCYGIWAEGTSTGGNFSSQRYGVVARGPVLAGLFGGDVEVNGTLTKSAGAFKIDHPLDPANKYLTHSFVESPDMMNIYNGMAKLDGKGEAWVSLPAWFEALNANYRYQLTAIASASPNLHVGAEIDNGRFKIAGGNPGGKVSWQVTGVRHDAYADAHRLKVEEDKPADERGTYLHPELFKQGADRSAISRKLVRATPAQTR